jgi:hypothetical protein
MYHDAWIYTAHNRWRMTSSCLQNILYLINRKDSMVYPLLLTSRKLSWLPFFEQGYLTESDKRNISLPTLCASAPTSTHNHTHTCREAHKYTQTHTHSLLLEWQAVWSQWISALSQRKSTFQHQQSLMNTRKPWRIRLTSSDTPCPRYSISCRKEKICCQINRCLGHHVTLILTLPLR